MMSYRVIAVHANESRHAVDRIRLAARIALDHQAHLVGVAASALPPSFYMSGISGEGTATLTAYLDFMKERADVTLDSFEAAAKQAGVTSYEKRVIEDEPGMALCLQARYSDLLVLSQPDPDEEIAAESVRAANYVVVNSCRPVLLVPYAGKFESVNGRALVAWDGSPEAARAVSGAIPLLRQAKLVQVAVFNAETGRNAHGDEPGADIAHYLARHGVTVEVSRQFTGGEIDVGNAMLSYIDDFGADLAVMGAYGHSRLREALLGGVTRTVLQAMTVPILMSH
jgi:nucleotide-binding universal stress UspA family protein